MVLGSRVKLAVRPSDAVTLIFLDAGGEVGMAEGEEEGPGREEVEPGREEVF